MIKPCLYIKDTENKGRGVFTSKDIAEGTTIEVAPVIVMSGDDRIHLDKTLLHDYIFEWGKDKDKCCMALGYMPVYNHSYKSNCEYFMDFDHALIYVKTVRLILSGEEVTINYNGDWDDETPLWFDVV